MLRPERMSKVSVAGSKRVLEPTIEAVHELDLLHISEYDESWEGFEIGRSVEGAEQINQKLVTVRSLESILGVTADDVTERIVIDEAELEAELETLQQRVNELDDDKSDTRAELRELNERIESLEPLVDLGIDLELLGGYDSLVVSVGQGNREPLEAALDDSEAIETFEVMSGGRTHAVFAKPAADAGGDVLADALVGVEFTTVSVPDADGSPEAYVAELQERKAAVQSELDELNAELESIKAEQAGFLLSAEEYLSIEAQKKEAPLSFATTENAFIAEGWIPSDRYSEFESELAAAVDGPLEIEEIKRAAHTASGHAAVDHSEPEEPTDEASPDETSKAAEESGEQPKARADGGVVTTNDSPPIIQKNPGVASPFEVITNAVSRPKYSEFDPTLLVFLTFPLMFGFMIGDIGYGVLYFVIGYYLYRGSEGAMRDMGSISMWAGIFTILFGIYYGIDIFGYHAYPLLGLGGVEFASKGLSPGAADWAVTWLTISAVFGILHLNIGYAVSFISNYQLHDLKHAIYESGSWLLLLNGIWIWVFSQHGGAQKPDFLFDFVAVITAGAVEFPGLPETVGIAGLLLALVGFILLAIEAPSELAEVLEPVVNVISYARIMAVLLAKGGMALAVNLIAFGAYIDQGGEGSYNFIFTPSRLAEVQANPEQYEVVFGGMSTAAEASAIGVLAIVGAIFVAIVGHIIVLLLGITAAGIQGVRLEYVEFFNKFYEGGGRPYNPFGYDRTYTTTDD